MNVESVLLKTDGAELKGDLTLDSSSKALILFAHGSGSSRLSSRNRYVASELVRGGMATFLLDLLSAAEERDDDLARRLRFDVSLLAHRLILTTEWLKMQKQTAHLKLGLFGASTGGGAALIAAAKKPELFYSVISRGGRPDLAETMLHLVKAPTLLIVGGDDHAVISLNEYALKLLNCEKKMEVVPEASHLFQEPGKLQIVASMALSWFIDHL